MHRQAHFHWGIDPADSFNGGDPFLADYYDGVEQDSGPTLDRDEEVAGVFNVEINFEARATARVVAANESQAKEKAERLRLNNENCVGGWVPEASITHSLHETAREVKSLTRGEIADSEDVDEDAEGINYADRLEGWPW
jgi:hypothetical protein